MGWRTASKALHLLPQQASMGLMRCTSPHLAPRCGHRVLCRAVRTRHLLWLCGAVVPRALSDGQPFTYQPRGRTVFFSKQQGVQLWVQAALWHLYPLSCTTLATLRQRMLGRCPGPGCNTVAAEHCSVNAEKKCWKVRAQRESP